MLDSGIVSGRKGFSLIYDTLFLGYVNIFTENKAIGKR